jgi:hypothetical protein
MPTINIPDKICSHCGGISWMVSNRKRILVSGEVKMSKSYICNKKLKESNNGYIKRNIDKYRKRRREYIKKRLATDSIFAEKTRFHRIKSNNKHKEKVLNRTKEWKIKNVEKVRAHRRKDYAKGCKNLSDFYVINSIKRDSDLSRSDIPQELIEIKRKQLLLIRQIKNNGKEKTIKNN